MTGSVIPILREWSTLARKGGFVPDDCARNVTALSSFVSGVHHGLWLSGNRDDDWAAFAAWLTGRNIALGNESPLDAVRRLAPSEPIVTLGDWLASYASEAG